MTIPVEVLDSMDGFVVNCNGKGMVCLGFGQGIQERNSPIFLVTFDCELYCWIYTVDMFQTYLFIGLLLNDKSVSTYLNQCLSKFNLSHIWDRVLLNTPGLKLNSNKCQVQIHNNRHKQPIPHGSITK